MFKARQITFTLLSDEQLMEQVSKGARPAFETLYDRYFNKLVWFARGFLADEQQAEDLVQDVFIRIIEAPEKFDSTKKFSTWVYVVVSNQCKQALRNQKNRLRIVQEKVSPLTERTTQQENNADAKLLRERISTIYLELSEKEQGIYTLRFEQELSIKEIAGAMSIPEGSVKSGIYYLLKKFANQLKDFES